MRAKQAPCIVAILALAFVLPLPALGAGAEGKEGKKAAAPTPWTGPVPRAECGPNDHTESGLQGQTTLAERFSGDSMRAYTCNLELVGQFTGVGAKYQMTWFGKCAYYGTTMNPGTVVIDASDPERPVPTAYLTDPSMQDPHESLKVHNGLKLLAGVEERGPGFAIYDLSADCRYPRLLSSVVLQPPDPLGHAGDFSPDGKTYYGTSTNGVSLYPIDIADPTNPRLIMNWVPPGGVGRPHDLSVGKDGTRLYIAQRGNNFPFNNGLTIMDISDFQERRPNPQFRLVGSLYWDDGRNAQMPTQITIKGRPYILFSDESGSRAFDRTAACAEGLSPYGFARLIDMSDETNPKLVSKLMLEVSDPVNCPSVMADTSASVTFGYDSHYCTVDDSKNASLAICSYFQAGVRVFDIRDPYRPREVAYYKPGAVRTASRPGSTLDGRDRTYDYSSSNVRFVKQRGESYLWFTSHDNGFQIVRFTKSMKELLGKAEKADKPEKREKSDKPDKPGKGRQG